MLEVKNLSCRRGGRVVFREVGFYVAAGGYLSVKGANGSGKSSLLQSIAGLIEPMPGAVLWQGAAIGEDRAAHNARLRYIGHLDAVKPGLTVGEMLGYWRALRGVGFADVLDAFGLRGLVDRPVRSLSAGQKKRLSLTRLMMDDAPLWLLDEASASLDKEGQELLRAQIARHRGADGIVIAATHDEENIQDAQHLMMGAP